MNVARTENLVGLLDAPMTAEELEWDHAMEISATVHRRMEELGIKGKDLARLMDVKPARVSRMLSGEQSMTLRTLARLEVALGIDMSAGFSDPSPIERPETPAWRAKEDRRNLE